MLVEWTSGGHAQDRDLGQGEVSPMIKDQGAHRFLRSGHGLTPQAGNPSNCHKTGVTGRLDNVLLPVQLQTWCRILLVAGVSMST